MRTSVNTSWIKSATQNFHGAKTQIIQSVLKSHGSTNKTCHVNWKNNHGKNGYICCTKNEQFFTTLRMHSIEIQKSKMRDICGVLGKEERDRKRNWMEKKVGVNVLKPKK